MILGMLPDYLYRIYSEAKTEGLSHYRDLKIRIIYLTCTKCLWCYEIIILQKSWHPKRKGHIKTTRS